MTDKKQVAETKEKITTYDPYNELNIIQSIITTQEELVFKIGSWAIGLITAITIALFHKDTQISWPLYLIIGLAIIFTFYIVGIDHWKTFKRANNRSKEIENKIKKGEYTFPDTNNALKKENDIKTSSRFYSLYILLFIIVISSSVFSYVDAKNNTNIRSPIIFNIDQNTSDYELIFKKPVK